MEYLLRNSFSFYVCIHDDSLKNNSNFTSIFKMYGNLVIIIVASYISLIQYFISFGSTSNIRNANVALLMAEVSKCRRTISTPIEESKLVKCLTFLCRI